MMKKRITALITAVMMLTTLLPMTFISGANAAATAPSGQKIIADFSGGEIPSDVIVKNRNGNTSTAAGIDNSVSYNGTSSLYYTFNTTESHIIIPYTSDWDAYDTFNIRLYAERPNQTVALIINDTAEASSSKDNNYHTEKHTFNGSWQTLSVNVSKIKDRWILDNDKKPIAPENIYILISCSGWNLTPGTVDQLGTTYIHANGQTYTYGSVKGEKFYIDSIWLGKSNFGGTMNATGASIEHGAGDIPANLDGNNTFTVNFDKTLWNTDYSESVKVYDITDGAEVLADATYSVNVSGSSLNVVFDSELSTADYKIVIDSDAFWGINGETLSNDAEYIFSVGKGSVFFLVNGVSLADGTIDVEPSENFEYQVTFNNNIDASGGVDNFVSITADGAELEINEDFAVDCTDNVLTITFNGMLKGRAEYAITLSSEICDEYTQYLDEDITYTFTTTRATTYIGSDGIVFDARNESDLEDGLLKPGGMTAEITSENALLGDKTLKLSYKAGQDKTATISPRLGDITGYTYINWLIYSPKADGEGMRLMIGTVRGEPDSGKDSYFLYTTKTDWAGWKVISVPVDSMEAARKPDKTQVTGHTVNFGGWSDARTEDGYILVDRIWYSNEEVKPVSLESTEYEYEKAFVPSDLGGDNAYTFTFDQELIDRDYSDLVSIYKYDGSEFVKANSAFEIVVDGKNLNIKFPSGLTNGNTYQIKVDTSKIISADASFGSEEYETVFTVGAASPYFKVVDYSFNKAVAEGEANTFTFTFNNEPANSDLPDYIALYADGKKVYNAYKYAKDGNKLVLTFEDVLKYGVTYTLKISDSYADIYSNSITDKTEFEFYLGDAVKSGNTLVVFSANDAEDFNNAIKRGDIAEENATLNLYDKTARLNYTAGTDVSKYPLHMETTDITGMKYLNMWLYCPKATGFPIGIVVYNDMAGKNYVYYGIEADWVGWKLITIDNSLVGGYSSVETVNINMGGWGKQTAITENTYLLVDEIWFSKSKPSGLKFVSSSIPDGYADAAITGEVLKLEFSDTLGDVQNPSITVTNEAGDVITDYSVSYSENNVIITFGTLTANTKYTVTADGFMGTQPVAQESPVTLSFTTALEGVYVADIALSESASQITALFDISNLTSKSVKLQAVVIAADEDNRIIAAETSAFDAPAGETQRNITLTCSEEPAKLWAYVLDSHGRIVSDKYLSGSDIIIAGTTGGSKYGVSIDSADVNVNVLEIKGTACLISDAVLIEIKGDDVISKGIAKADSNGSFTYYYVFPNEAESASYTVTVSADGVSSQKTITYISKEDRDNILALANGSSAKDFAKYISDMKAALGLEDVSEKEIESIAEIAIDQPAFDTYSDVIAFIVEVVDLLDEINSAKWNSLAQIIISNTDILGDNDDMEYFDGLKEKGKNKVCEILVNNLPADSIADFLDKLADSIDEYKENLEDEEDKKSGGSGGGGGKATSSAIYPTGTAGVTPYTPIEANNVFTDLSEALWAQDSIMTLYKEGIVSHPTDGRFRPNDKITREEFVKMVVCAFINNTAYSTHRFADEAAGAWYNEYLAKAYAAGITTGYPDGRFGIGENITREDMVTICARTLEALGENMTSAYDGGFADSALISDYAAGYVGAMTQTGVINGMGDGSFAPKANATRAEAAKVIAKLIELY